MQVRYQEGDKVYDNSGKAPMGSPVVRVVKVGKSSLTVENLKGERYQLHSHQFEPCRSTIRNALWLNK